MHETPEVKVTLSAHTESRGSKTYNQKLSEKRAQSVVNYLLQKGIDADRIVGKGFGETVPVNNCVDMVVCSPEDFRINRRTEFFIPELGKSESVNQKGKGDYTTGYDQPVKKSSDQTKNHIKKSDKYAVIIGSFKDLPNAERILDQLKKNGYQPELLNGAEMFTVGVSYKDIKSAQEGLNKLKSEFPGAWIL
jgi:hypothetical protein